MSPLEQKAATGLAGIFSMRMLGLFMILPVMSLYAGDLEGATPLLIGLSISAYGLTQALLQIPFGLMSDRIGRKRIITLGLVLFAAGSVVAAMSETIYGVILGRALQGSGAVAAAVMALAADLTREENRTKIMATIGISIGISFGIAMVLGPIIGVVAGLEGIFWLTSVLAVIAIIILHKVVPTPARISIHKDAEPIPRLFSKVLKDKELLRLDVGIFCLHLVITAMFVVLPLVFLNNLEIPAGQHWMVYLSVIGLSVLAMIPLVIIAESKRKMKLIFVGGVGMLCLATFAMYLNHESFWGLLAALFVFFTAFNLLEATLPSLVSKISFAEGKGTAMGVYSTGQFLGAFFGGITGGAVYGAYGYEYVFLVCAGVLSLWFLVAFGMKSPRYVSSLLKHINVKIQTQEQLNEMAKAVSAVPGVISVAVSIDDTTAYLKVDNSCLDEQALDKIFS